MRRVRVKRGVAAPIAGAVPTPTFADLLDSALQQHPVPPAGAASPAPWASRLVSDMRTPMLPGEPLTAATPRWLAAELFAAPRPDHVMTSAERLAFTRFAALGGALRRNFTAADLRREHRLLAQRYHPDRNPAATPFDREMLAARFAEATACYRTLRALVLQ